MDSEDPKTGLGCTVLSILKIRDSGWVIQLSFHEF